MISTLAIANYRSLRSVIAPLGPLNLVSGENGSGKSSLYRALRLLAETAQGGVVASIAREGGLSSTLWAGPEKISRAMRKGEQPVQGGPRRIRTCCQHSRRSRKAGRATRCGSPRTWARRRSSGRA